MKSIYAFFPLAAVFLLLPFITQAAELEPAPSIADEKSEVAADVKLTLVANWQVGDSYRIAHTKERMEVRNGAAKPKRTSRSLSQVTVAEKNENGYILISTLIEADLSNYATPGQGGAEAAAAFTKLFEGQSLELVTNESGFPIGLRNGDEVIELMRAAMDQVVTAAASDPKEQQQIRALMDQMMTPQVIESMALKDAISFYGLMGGSYQGGGAVTSNVSMPFPFTQKPIDAKLVVLLRDIDEKNGLVRIASQSFPDADAVRQATIDWMTQLVQSQGKLAPDPAQIPQFYMQDSFEFVFDLNKRLARKIDSERYFSFGTAMTRVDRATYRLVPE